MVESCDLPNGGPLMGWLRDLMNAADPPLRSFGTLAAETTKSTFWPADIRFKGRSFETLLSRLDRGQDLAWLGERISVQRALAGALRASLDEIRRAVGQPSGGKTPDRVLRFLDLPTARPFDFATEALPPGIPAALAEPWPEPLWWLAASGSGRSLVGRWLQIQGRASVVSSADAAAPGPRFLELEAAVEAPAAAPGLCVAAPFPPPRDAGFRVIRAPDLLEVLPELLAWVAARLPVDARLDPLTLEGFLSDRVRSGVFDTFGAVISAIGWVDEVGLREVSSKSNERLAQRFVESRIARVVEPSEPFAGWLRKSIYPALLGLAERALVDSELPLESPRTFEQWLALVPAELERHVDLDWMRLSLSRLGSGIRPIDIERAAQRLPPGAFRVVTALEQAGILRRDATDRLSLGPAWLQGVLRQTAVGSLTARSPFEWGEALLRPHAAAEIAGAVLERTLAEGSGLLEAVLDLEAEEQPAYAAAVDVALRAAGVSLLLGNDLSQEVLSGLFRESANLALELGDGVPLPRIELGDALAERPTTRYERGRALLSAGSYYLAALRVSEALEDPSDSRLRALDPWRQTRPAPALAVAYDAIAASLTQDLPWKRAAQAMIARIRANVGNVLDAELPHPLELPAYTLDEIEHGVLTFETLERAPAGSDWLETLLSLADQRGTPRGDVARAIWVAWDEAQRPTSATYLAPGNTETAWFWSYVPGALVEHWLVDARSRHVPYEAFRDEQWEAFARGLARAPALVADSEAWRAMPAEWAHRLLRWPLEWGRAERSVRVLWQRFPELLKSTVEQQLALGAGADSQALSMLLQTAPRDVALAFSIDWERSSSFAPTTFHALRALLRRLVAERGPNWRDAYASLSRLERELRRVS